MIRCRSRPLIPPSAVSPSAYRLPAAAASECRLCLGNAPGVPRSLGPVHTLFAFTQLRKMCQQRTAFRDFHFDSCSTKVNAHHQGRQPHHSECLPSGAAAAACLTLRVARRSRRGWCGAAGTAGPGPPLAESAYHPACIAEGIISETCSGLLPPHLSATHL